MMHGQKNVKLTEYMFNIRYNIIITSPPTSNFVHKHTHFPPHLCDLLAVPPTPYFCRTIRVLTEDH